MLKVGVKPMCNFWMPDDCKKDIERSNNGNTCWLYISANITSVAYWKSKPAEPVLRDYSFGIVVVVIELKLISFHPYHS